MDKIRKIIAEVLFELGFIILPKFKSSNYIYNHFETLNVKYLKVQCSENINNEWIDVNNK